MLGSPCSISVDDLIVAPSQSAATSSATSRREADALLLLSQTLARDPSHAIQQLSNSALSLTEAGSAGVTLEDMESGECVLRWIATSGKAKAYEGGTIPRDFSPCGEAINRGQSLLMQDPVRHYTYLRDVHLPIRTALLVPFARRGRFVGTVWAIRHNSGGSFDTEQRRIVESLATFASAILDAQELRGGRRD